MTVTFLGLIALGTLTTAILQVVVIVALIRAGKSALDRVERIRALVAPLPAHVASIREDVERMQAVAEAQLGKVGAMYAMVEPSWRYGMTAIGVARGVIGFMSRRTRR